MPRQNDPAPQTPPAAPEPRIEKERAQFKELILANPNYFQQVMKKASDTSYEQVTCVGYSPDLALLEATIQIKRSFGYGGNLCQTGTNEYVRFFVNYGSGWQDAGLVATNIHDIPAGVDCAKQDELPLSYVVTLKLQPQTNVCGHPVLPDVRAILSWNVAPPAGSANAGWVPVWGNVLDHHVQIKPRRPFILDLAAEIAAEIKQTVKLPPEYEAVASFPIPLPDPGPLTVAQLAQIYQAKGAGAAAAAVPAHRFGLADVQATATSTDFGSEAVTAKIAEWKAIGLSWEQAVAALDNTKADVTYEEIECLGLDDNLERLVATFRIKRPTGYSGGLCQAGSQEYIAFWADWDDTCTYTYLGTVAVNVHDIASIPADGLSYSAILPVDLTYHRQPCDQPKIGRVRAVLSWAVPPSTVDPDALNFWGNRLDAHVQINPGPVVQPGTVTPIIGVLGGIPISQIDLTSGMTTPTAKFALTGIAPDSLGRACPFSGRVVLQGPSYPGYNYRVQVRPVGAIAWTTVTTTMTLVDWTGTVFTTQAADGSGFFSFVPFTLNVDNVLAWWDTAGDDLWEIKLEVATTADVLLPGVASHRIQLDNTAPVTAVHLDSSGDCGKFTVGTVLTGHFVARDANFGSFSLGTSPFAGPVVPASGTVQTAPSPGDAWTLNTTGMTPCGYVIDVVAVDRAIVNSSFVGHWSSSAAGFCLEAAT